MIVGRMVRGWGRRWRRFVLRGVLLVAALVAVLAVTLPWGLGYGIERWLTDRGADEVRIENVDVDLFTMRFAIRNVRAGTGGAEPARAAEISGRLAAGALFGGRLLFDTLTIRNAELAVDQSAGGLRVAGLALGTADGGKDGGAPVGIRSLEVSDSRARVESGGETVSVVIERARLKGLVPWRPEDETTVDLTGRLAGGAVEIAAAGHPFASAPAIDGRLRLESVPIGPVAAVLGAVGMPSGRVGADLAVAARFGAAGLERATAEGSLGAKDLEIRDPPRVSLAAAGLGWTGRLTFGRGGPDGEGALALDGGLTLRTVRLAGDFLADGAALRAERLEADALAGTPGKRLTARALTARNLEMGTVGDGENRTPTVVVGKLTVADAVLDAYRRFEADSVAAEDAVLAVHRDAAGIRGPHDLPARGNGAVEDPGAAAEAEPFTVALSRVALTGDSAVHFRDETVSPAFEIRIPVARARVEGLDTAESAAPLRFDLALAIGQYGEVALEGTARPFAAAPAVEATGKVKGVELPPFSPYLVKDAGYAFRSGQLSAGLDIGLKDDQLDSVARVNLHNLSVARQRESAAKEVTASLDMPLEAALALLRDDNDDISLTLPLRGHIDTPQFDLGDVVGQAVGNAIKRAGLAFLKYTLQPFGAILAVGEFALEQATAVRLEPLAFDAGSAALPAKAPGYLERIAEVLRKRPELRIRLCPVATADDRAALAAGTTPENPPAPQSGTPETAGSPVTDATLQALATARARAVKARLVEGHGVAADRLFLCAPRVEAGEGAPRVELLI